MDSRLNLRAVTVLAALLLVGVCCGGSSGSGPAQDPATTATEAPATTAVGWPHDWTEKTVGGAQFDAGDYAGQDLVLWFWAPW